MEKTDVLVIGGSAAGIVAATTGKMFYPDKDVMIIRKEEQAVVPCGIPYIFGTLDSSDKNVMPAAALESAGVTLKIAEVSGIDTEKKVCTTSDNAQVEYDKLIIATGSTPSDPAWLKGADLGNVMLIPKDKNYLDEAKAILDECLDVVVIGGGFIGVEMADELKKKGKKVTIVELMPNILSLAFDKELAEKAQEVLASRGVNVITGAAVKEIVGSGKAEGVVLDNGETIKADAVILSTGYRPNTALAVEAGIPLNDLGFIKVNEYMRTENPDIFAIGDCAEKFSFVTRTPKPGMLASTACAEARIAGMNLFKLSTIRSFGGTISIFSTAIGETAFGSAGATERILLERGFDIISGVFEGIDKHPGTLPGTQKQLVKLIVSKESGIILGAGIIGGQSVGELTNLAGFAIQNGMTVSALLTSQIGTHPLLTAPPTAYPLIKAAEVVIKKFREGYKS